MRSQVIISLHITLEFNTIQFYVKGVINLSKLGEKFPQSLYAHLMDEDSENANIQWQRAIGLVEREEKFREHLLDKEMEALNRFSDSIMALAVAISDRSTAPNIINIYADKDFDIEKVLSGTSNKVYYNGMINDQK